jgi:putative ABC transport system substrate-binding protein
MLTKGWARRLILVALAVALLFQARSALAADKSIGVVMSGDLPRYQEAHKAFVAELARAGFDQSRVSIYVQTPHPDQMSWTNSVRKFVGVEVDVIVAYGAPAALAALRQTDSIPVVFAYVYDPQACGARKKNSTGVSSKVPMATLLKTLKSIVPFEKMAVLYNPDERDSVAQLDEATRNSAALGFRVVDVAVKSPGEAKGKIAKAVGQADCIYVSCASTVGMEAGSILSVANRNRLPVVTQVSGLTERGALLSLAPSSQEQGELAARGVARILKGERPYEIPVENAKKVDFVLNLKAANSLELKVPFDVLNAATKVIK